jgi:hypothetical protein
VDHPDQAGGVRLSKDHAARRSSVQGSAVLDGGLTLVKAKSSRIAAEGYANREVGKRIAGEPVFRCPWRSPPERAAFLEEQTEAGIDGASLAAVKIA